MSSNDSEPPVPAQALISTACEWCLLLAFISGLMWLVEVLPAALGQILFPFFLVLGLVIGAVERVVETRQARHARE